MKQTLTGDSETEKDNRTKVKIESKLIHSETVEKMKIMLKIEEF